MERNGYSNGMETELQSMDRNGEETEEKRGMEGGENVECKGMETEEYKVYLVPPLTWWNTLLVIPVFFWKLTIFFVYDLVLCVPLVLYAVFTYLTGRSQGWFPFHLTRECFVYPLLEGTWYASYYHNFPSTTKKYLKEPLTFGY